MVVAVVDEVVDAQVVAAEEDVEEVAAVVVVEVVGGVSKWSKYLSRTVTSGTGRLDNSDKSLKR